MRKLSIVLVIILSWFAVRNVFGPGFFPVHDNAQIARVYEMSKVLVDGQFPGRYVPDLGFGYGYPIFTFYAPLSYYVGAFVHFVSGVDVLWATKIMMAMGMLLAGITMYLLASEFWGIAGGIISALLYLYAPYHALDVYVRGDVAEMWAYGFVPLVFWGIYKIYLKSQKSNRKSKELFIWISVTALSYAVMILSHNLTALMVTPFVFSVIGLFSYDAFKHKNPLAICYLLSAFLLGLLVAATYWLPVFFELRYTNVLSQIGRGFDFHDHFVCLSQFWYSPWGYGGSAKGCTDGLSFMLGKIPIFLALSAMVIGFILPKKDSKKIIILGAGAGLLISLLLCTSLTQFVWEIINPMAFFQFPWRFLIMVNFFLSFLGGVGVWYLEKYLSSVISNNVRNPVGMSIKERDFSFGKFHLVSPFVEMTVGGVVVILVIGIIALNIKFFVPAGYIRAPSSYFTGKTMLNWDVSNPSNEYMPKGFKKPKNKSEIPEELFEITDSTTIVRLVLLNAKQKVATIQSQGRTTLHVNLAYFPSWQVVLDGKAIPFTVTNRGMDISVPSGMHVLRVYYRETMIEKLADTITVIGIVLMVIGIILTGSGGMLPKPHEKKKR